MASQSASPEELADIQRLANDPDRIEWTETARYDVRAHGLSTQSIINEVIAWIDRGERVKRVTLRGKHSGQSAYEMKPRINNVLFYIKLTLCQLGTPSEYLLVISTHPNH